MNPAADRTVRCLFCVVLFVGFCALAVQARADEGFSFPAASPEQMGLDHAKLEQAQRYALSAGGSGMIVQHGRVVLRWGDRHRRYDIKSATKSFGATMLGIAIRDGKIKLDAPARQYHPTLGVPPQSNAETGWLDEITIRHLATQTAGFDKPGGYERLLFKPRTLTQVPRDAYWAWGLYDSLVVVIPSLDLVVVRGGERGRSLAREKGADHYTVLGPLLNPIVLAVLPSGVFHSIETR